MKDYRKLRIRHVGESAGRRFIPLAETPGGYSLTHFDEFIDELLTQDRVCDIILPRLTQRAVLEESEGLQPRRSLLVSTLPRLIIASLTKQEEDADMDRRARSLADEESDGEDRDTKRRRYSPSSSRESSPDLRGRPRTRSRSVSSAGSRYLSRSPSRSGSDGEEGDTRGRYISRSPSISPDRALGAEDNEKLDGDV